MNETPIGRVRGLHEPPLGTTKGPEPAAGPESGRAPGPGQGPAPSPAQPPRSPEREDPDRPRRPRDVDEDIDRDLEEALARPVKGAPAGVPLKRQWDDDLEAELEAALEGFDATAIDVPRQGRTRVEDRAHVPKGGRGQEERPGPQKGKVVAIRGHDVFLDLGAKSEGIVPLEQFDERVPEVGEIIDVMFDRLDPDEGLMIMSLKGAAVHATWENLRQGMVVEARVIKDIKGGLQVEVDGIRGFLPISQIEIGRVEDTKVYVNQRLKCLVTEANQRERNLVVSRRDLLEQEREEQREKTWAELEEGQVRKGIVRSVRDFGAFVDVGGVDGLVHVSDLTWMRGQKPQDIVKIGDEVEVKVLRIDRETKKVGLGLKQLAPSPWDHVEDNYARGQTVKGKVTRLMDFGAFVELEPGIEGLIHVSEMANKRVFRVKDHVEPDQEVEVRILDIDPEAKRISLSLKPGPAAPVVEEEPEGEDASATPKPERKVPLKGGLGDREPNPFRPKG